MSQLTKRYWMLSSRNSSNGVPLTAAPSASNCVWYSSRGSLRPPRGSPRRPCLFKRRLALRVVPDEENRPRNRLAASAGCHLRRRRLLVELFSSGRAWPARRLAPTPGGRVRHEALDLLPRDR